MTINEEEDFSAQKGLKGKKISWQRLRRNDSLDIESRSVGGHHAYAHASKGCDDWSVIIQLAFQSIGIVYGDIGTSPLYVYSSTFTNGIKHNDDILGVLSLIFYTITLIPLIKYVFIVLQANDNGDGGTFALYSLICRYAKVGLTPSEQAEDRDVSNFQLELPSNKLKMASKLKSKLENSKSTKYFLLFATMLGTSMVIGDGVLTPCISVLSAVGGIKDATSNMNQDMIVWISVGILICLFMVQRFGTDKVGYSFAPIICLWFALISGIGLYNFVKFDPSVVKAINPKYIVDYFRRNNKDAWISLGGIVLAITASFLRKHNDVVSDTFYKSIPKPLYWPMFVVAVCAAIIASQAMISGTFSIIQQSLSLGCFPRVKIVHTSTKYVGQVFVPEANYLLMLACVAVTISFRTTTKIGNAYGIAVVFVMTLTSSFLVLIMVMIWKTNIFLVITYIVVIGSVEFLYLSSVLYKFNQGGYLPLAFAGLLMAVMFVWNDVYRRKYYYELDHKLSPEKVKEITNETNFHRLPGLAMFYSELVQGIPPIFKHYAENVPALHSVLVFVSIKSLPISKVPHEERFLFRRIEPKNLFVFRCVARYGYTDVRNEHEPFETMLVDKLKEFVENEFWLFHIKTNSNKDHDSERLEGLDIVGDDDDEGDQHEKLDREIEAIDKAWRAGVVHLMGENEVVACKGSGIDMIVWISVGILICLFMVQRFGTDKVGYSFAPIICLWFALISGIGLYNFVKFDPSVVKAINPKYIVDYFRRNNKDAWISLGGIVLAITASFLRKHNDVVSDTFYKSIPKPLYWPMFVVAVCAAIIASQAMISGTFSIIQQSLSLGCFPRVKIVHTSTKYVGQVFVPEANYLLMLACVAVTISFRTTTKIGNAYGIAVVFVMTLTSSFLVLIMVMIWKTNIFLVITYIVVIGSVEFLYLSSVLYKFNQGGYLPLAFAGLLMAVMFVWNDVYRRKYYYELDHKLSPEKVKEITNETNFHRLPGLAMFYSELVQGIPPIFKHYAENVPALHSVLVFVSIKSLPISKVPHEERFLFRRIEPKNLFVFRCVARYGYTDVRNEHEPFETMLVDKLKEFVENEFWLFHIKTNSNKDHDSERLEGLEIVGDDDDEGDQHEKLDREIEAIDKAWRAGVVHLMGENEVVACKGSGIGKRVLIDYAYNFLKKNLRQTDKLFDVPHKRMLKVGMTYEL
ncbi:hypothetical protein G4B88_000218 [Cannabis sativa]|uniref:Potassium transporter n=1 Tax=Cannabis sativa TaxID=3483 RepID=A0A7J6GPH6_CANSA|nr:hypothetical protein G4B88_000218 [Cannabis sativa]